MVDTATRDTNQDWSRLAEESPYWGILSQDRFRGLDLSPEAEAEFFASGEKLIAKTVALSRRHLVPNMQIRRALDFGCGVGRVLLPLARLSTEAAVGVDVAPKMLELARANLEKAGLSHAQVVMGDDEFSQVRGGFDFVNSVITLQHIQPERGIAIVTRLLGLLDVGGVFSLQTIYARERQILLHEKGRAKFYRRVRTGLQYLVEIPDSRPEGVISMYDYDLNELMLVVLAVAAEPLMVLPTDHGGHRGVHLIGCKAREAR
ncbi:MAG TPA: class I SAM-dependent methyltransferase [Rhizomicrobium sp.]|jgi:SAM-dependent methyltransferase|nr:class I SAM-dependent methyltransferase [Rhizomicrobium sp.]